MICPRCDKDEAYKFFEAPKDGSWELYRCRFCDFVWRSTEDEEIRNKDLYDPRFKLDEAKMSLMEPKLPIPPLKKK